MYIIKKTDNTAWAVITGINNYQGAILRYCGADAIVLKNSLIGSDFWSNAEIVKQYNVSVTKSMIQNAITEAKNNVKPCGTFVFFYSGHGSSDNTIGYIIPQDGISNGYADLSKCISETELQTWLGQFDSSVKKVCLLDSCFSGEFIDKFALKYNNQDQSVPKFVAPKGSTSGSNPDFGKSLSVIENMVTISASGRYEYSYENSVLKNGYFTYFLIEGLGNSGTIYGPADFNTSKSITAEESYSYLSPKVTNYKSNQHPKINDNYVGEITIK